MKPTYPKISTAHKFALRVQQLARPGNGTKFRAVKESARPLEIKKPRTTAKKASSPKTKTLATSSRKGRN